MKVVRDGKERNLTATVASMPEGLFAREGRSRSGNRNQSGSDALDGVEVTDLDAQARRQFNIPSSVRGVLVTSIEEDSNSAEAGLRTGDVIVEINRQPVTGANDAVTMSEKAKGDRILLRVWSADPRGGSGGTRYITVDNTKRK
jgi:serine protease Do